MHHKQGESRGQMFMFWLESAIAEDAMVRVIDAFVDAIDLKSFGFHHVECQEEGRPPYHPGILMKLYLYGYRYGIRTSRKLEREARTNIEVYPCPGQGQNESARRGWPDVHRVQPKQMCFNTRRKGFY